MYMLLDDKESSFYYDMIYSQNINRTFRSTI